MKYEIGKPFLINSHAKPKLSCLRTAAHCKGDMILIMYASMLQVMMNEFTLGNPHTLLNFVE